MARWSRSRPTSVAADFERLWSQRRETLQKARYSWPDGRFHWDVDFFKTDEGRTYFAQAEVEMPEDRQSRRRCRRHWPGICWRWRRPAICASPPSAWPTGRTPSSLLADIRKKGKIE